MPKKNTEVEETPMDMDMFGDYEDSYEDNYEEGHEEVYELGSETSEQNIIGKVVNTAKENKIATAGVASLLGIGLWRLFGKQTPDQNTESQSMPQEYQDELLGLDEEDSIDDFIDQQSQRTNPLFQPLRFK